MYRGSRKTSDMPLQSSPSLHIEHMLVSLSTRCPMGQPQKMSLVAPSTGSHCCSPSMRTKMLRFYNGCWFFVQVLPTRNSDYFPRSVLYNKQWYALKFRSVKTQLAFDGEPIIIWPKNNDPSAKGMNARLCECMDAIREVLSRDNQCRPRNPPHNPAPLGGHGRTEKHGKHVKHGKEYGDFQR